MAYWRAVAEVARWEFLRFVKPKQQLIGMLVTFVILGGFLGMKRLGDEEAEVREIAYIGADILPLDEVQSSAMRFVPHSPTDEAALRERVRDGDVDGLLIVRDVDRAELLLPSRVGWRGEVELALGAARQQHVMQRAGVSAELLGDILTPPELEVTYPENIASHGAGERLAIIIIVSLMLMTVLIGMSYIFASITGEKQIRVTEQVVSAIPAQAWIDGKILGLIAVSLVGVLAQVFAFGAVYVLLRALQDAPALALPDSLGEPGIVTLIVVFGVLGLFFWFAFLGTVAASIDDPHNSARGSFLFVPMFATGMAYAVVANPQSGASRVFALFPPTAPSAMPVRLLMTDVGAGEVLLSLGLLVAAIFALRIAAGRIFRVAMLMYGKEPTWAELRRWAFGSSGVVTPP